MTTSSERTRKDLETAFWKLYAQKSVESISIRELTETAGYNRGTFYLHYQDIYALLESVESELLDHMHRCIDRCPSSPPSPTCSRS